MDFFDHLKDTEPIVKNTKNKTKKKSTFSIFDFINALTKTKKDLTDHPDFEKEYNPFMINRWLSMEPSLIYASFFANKTFVMSNKKMHFKFLLNVIDKGHYYIQYKKGIKDDPNVKLISEYYNVNEAQAKEIYLFLDEDRIKNIRLSFGGKK